MCYMKQTEVNSFVISVNFFFSEADLAFTTSVSVFLLQSQKILIVDKQVVTNLVVTELLIYISS